MYFRAELWAVWVSFFIFSQNLFKVWLLVFLKEFFFIDQTLWLWQCDSHFLLFYLIKTQLIINISHQLQPRKSDMFWCRVNELRRANAFGNLISVSTVRLCLNSERQMPRERLRVHRWSDALYTGPCDPLAVHWALLCARVDTQRAGNTPCTARHLTNQRPAGARG